MRITKAAHYRGILVKSLLGGIFVGISGVLYLKVENPIIGAICFGLGVFVAFNQGYPLYTGAACSLLGCKNGYLKTIPVIYAGNVIGAAAVGHAMRLTRFAQPLAERAVAVFQAKADDNVLSLFLLGVFCNLLIYMSAVLYKSPKVDPLTKNLGLMMLIPGFVVVGFENSIADVLYIAMANAWSVDAVRVLALVTLGNTAGAILVPLLSTLIPSEEKAV